MLSNRMCSKIVTLAGTALLCGATALAQSSAGQTSPSTGGGQTQPMPGSQTGNGTRTGTTPMGQPDANTGSMGTTGDTSMQDKAFVKKALEGGMAEVQLGNLALQKAQSDDVKKFAQKMVDDHTKLGDDMKQVAQQVNVKVPDGPSKKDKALAAKLQAMSGADFDKAYMKAMVKDHQQDDKDFKNEAQNGTIPQVKDAAAKGEPIISQHLQMAQQLASGNSSGMASMK